MVNLSRTYNTSTWDHSLFVTCAKSIFTRAKVLDATSGYTPTVGDILVKRKDSSDEDDRFSYDFYSTSGSATIDSSSYLMSLGNTSLIASPDDIASLVDSASATFDSVIGTTIAFVPGVPAYLDFNVTGSAVATAGFDMTFTFTEVDKDQEILGIVYEIDNTDTANVTLKIAEEAPVHFSALKTDGTSTAAKIVDLKNKLKAKNIETRN